MKKFLSPKSTQEFSAGEYIQIARNNRSNIKKVEFIPPTIGKKGYGKFRVTYRIPVLNEE